MQKYSEKSNKIKDVALEAHIIANLWQEGFNLGYGEAKRCI